MTLLDKLKKLSLYFDSVGKYGLDDTLNYNEYSIIRLSNYVAMGGIILCLGGSFLYTYQYFVFGHHLSSFIQLSISILQMIAIFGVLYLNKHSHYMIARYLLLTSYLLNISTIGILFQQESGDNFYFLLAPFGILVFLGLNRIAYFASFFTLILTLGIIYYQNHFSPILPMQPELVSHNYIITYTLVFLFLLLMTYFLLHINEKMNKKLISATEIDTLTGVYNRRKYDHFSKNAHLHAISTQTPLSLLIFDLDYFKRYNDAYGHLLGDSCLVEFSRVLKQNLKDDSSILVRFGGEEFIMILTNTSNQEALKIAQKIQNDFHTLSIEHVRSPINSVVTFSCGIATNTPQNYKDFSLLFTEADKNLYRAKKQGRNQIVA